MEYNYAQLRQQLKEDGYVVIPALLSIDETLKYRDIIKDYFESGKNYSTYTNGGMGVSNSFGFIADLRTLLSNKKITEVVSKICDHDLYYLHHCDAHYNRLSAWHKDSSHYVRNQWEERDGDESFLLYKLALYLQDHSSDSNALTVRAGSHMIDDLVSGKEVVLKPKLGDVILFDQRISHVGKQYDLKDKIVNRVFKFDQSKRSKAAALARKVFKEKDKFSIFWGVGQNNEFSKEFSKNIIARQNKQNSTESTRIYTEVIGYLREHNVKYLEHEMNEYLTN